MEVLSSDTNLFEQVTHNSSRKTYHAHSLWVCMCFC